VRPTARGSRSRTARSTRSCGSSRRTRGDGQGARTRYAKDLLGRLAQVTEFDDPAPGQSAITTFGYDALGRTTSITDADGTVTGIGYDFAGRRTLVTRGARVWRFSFDADGNPTSRQTPMPSGATAAQYTSTTVYDALEFA